LLVAKASGLDRVGSTVASIPLSPTFRSAPTSGPWWPHPSHRLSPRPTTDSRPDRIHGSPVRCPTRGVTMRG